MAKEFLQEAFKQLNLLGEDVFNVDDDGIRDLKKFEQESEKEVDTEIPVIDPEAASEEDLQDSYVGKVILECPVCHSFLFKDRAKIEINKVSELANSEEECPYCCTVGGFNIIGQVEEFDLNGEEDTEEADDDAEETTETEEIAEVEENNDEVEETVAEEEEVVEEGLEKHCDGENCDKEEGLLGTIAKGISPLPVVGNLLGADNNSDADKEEKEVINEETVCEKCGKNPCECADRELVEEEDNQEEGLLGTVAKAVSNVPVIGGILGENECKDGECEEKATDEGLLGLGLAGAAAGAGFGLGKKLVGESAEDSEECEDGECADTECEDEEECESIIEGKEAEHSISDIINEELGVDSWTTCTYDDEDPEVPIEVYSGDSLVGKFHVNEGKLVKIEESINEDLVVTTDDDNGTVEVSSTEEEKTVTIADNATEITTEETAEVAGEDNATEETEEVGEEEVKDETIVPLTDEEKEEIEKGSETTETSEDTATEETENAEETEETEVDVDEIEEESFDRLSEKFLKNTYTNVESYRTVSAKAEENTLKLEGIIKFKSGREKATSYILEAKDITPSGKARFVGENSQLSTAKKAFTVSGKLTEGKFIAESFNYNYNTKDTDGKSTKVYGTVSNKRK